MFIWPQDVLTALESGQISPSDAFRALRELTMLQFLSQMRKLEQTSKQ